MKQIALFIARRYLFNASHDQDNNHVSTMAKISFLGICIGTLALALVLAIMTGFEEETHKKMQGIHASIIMQSKSGKPLAYEKIAPIMSQEFPEIKSFSPSALAYVMISSDKNDAPMQLIALKGINPCKEADTTTLESTLQEYLESKKLSDLLHHNHVIIGEKLAQQLHCSIGDTITVLYTPDEQTVSNKIVLEKEMAIVGGIFKTGIEEFDANLCIASLSFLQTLVPYSEITHIGIRLNKGYHESSIIQKLTNRFGLCVYSWKDLYPALVSALILEKYASLIVLLLIVLVACLTIVSLIFMQIIQKRPDIALLKSLGASDKFIKNIFLSIGMIITITAATTGIVMAFGIGILLKYYIPIHLPDAYYVSHLPVSLNPWLFLGTWTAALCMSFLTTLYAVRTVKNINISNVLRFET